MPIANIVVNETIKDLSPDRLVDAWAVESAVDAEHMTVNLVSARQAGAGIALMAFLYLPSLWRAEQVRNLQLSLAKALSACSRLPTHEIQVVTTVVQSGHAIEGGRIQEW